MNQIDEKRREFLKNAALAALAFPLLLSCQTEASARKSIENILDSIKRNAVRDDGEWNGAKDAPGNVSWRADLAKDSDKGERIKIYGTVYESDGKTPAPNVLIYLYHTDIDGFYAKHATEHRHGRFRGWMLTDDKGRYEFTSIKAGQYPRRIDPAHIHFTLTAVNFKEHWIEDVWFAGDDRITPEIENRYVKSKGKFYPIVKLEKDANGVLNGRRDLLLKVI